MGHDSALADSGSVSQERQKNCNCRHATVGFLDQPNRFVSLQDDWRFLADIDMDLAFANEYDFYTLINLGDDNAAKV